MGKSGARLDRRAGCRLCRGSGRGRNHRAVSPRGRSERGACLHRFPECREFEHRFLRVIRKRGEDPPHLGGKSAKICRMSPGPLPWPALNP